MVPAIWVAAPLEAGRPRLGERTLLSSLVLGPVTLMLGISVLFGLQLRSLWATPLWTFLGVWLLAGPARGDTRPGKAARRYAAVVAALLLVAVSQQFLAPFATGRASRSHFPAQQLAARVEQLWRDRFTTPLPFIGGRVYMAGQLSLYAPATARAYSSDWPWHDDDALSTEGCVFAWETTDTEFAGELVRRFPGIELTEPLRLRWQTPADVAPVELRLALLTPRPRPGR